MPQHQISRKELKSDEFVSGVDAALEFFRRHRTRIIALAVVVLVVAASGYGYYAWQRSRNQAATALLVQGLDALHAPVAGSTANPADVTPGATTYPNARARAAAAAKFFAQGAAQYGSTMAGQLSRYYLGLAQLDQNDPAAEQTLRQAAASSSPVASTAAKHALANLDIANNHLAQAHALLLELTRQDSATLPRAVAMLELAELDRTYNPKEAARYYQQLQTDYPGTATAQQAKQELASLSQ